MQIKIIKRERVRVLGETTKIYSRNTNEYFVFFVDITERKTNRKEGEKISEKNIFNKKNSPLTVRYITFRLLKEFCDKRFKFRSTVFYDRRLLKKAGG